MEQIIDEMNTFIIYFEDSGYYADKQQSGDWNFTENYQYAKKYKTKKRALDLIKSSVNIPLYKNKKSYIQPLKIKQISEFILDRMEDIIIKTEEKNEVIITTTRPKVEIVSANFNDDFWNK